MQVLFMFTVLGFTLIALFTWQGTMLAVKAAGKMYGVAKKATSILVKTLQTESELIKGFALVRHTLPLIIES
jgi:predicted flavoprotein YhiN